MANETENHDPYHVGYGKPPKHTQFKKGQSGNPSGKSTKEESVKAKIKKIAGDEIIVHVNGSPVVMTNLEAMLHKAFMEAKNGNPQFFKFLVQELGVDPVDISQPSNLVLTEADLAVLKTQADWMGLIESTKAAIENTDGS